MKAHCTTCKRPTLSMRTDPTRCERCQQPYGVTTAPAASVENPSLFSGPAPYVAHSATSKAAAESVGNLSGKRVEVLREIVNHGPMTDNDLIAAMVARGWSHNTPRARRCDLFDAGLVEAVGQEGKSSLWGANDAGRAALAEHDRRQKAAA